MADNEMEKTEQEAQSGAPVNEQSTAPGSEAVSEQAPLPPLMQAVVDGIRRELPDLLPTGRTDGWVEVFVPADKLPHTALVLRDKLGFDFLSLLSAVDYKDKGFQVVYHVLNLLANKKLVIKVDLPDRSDPVVPTVVNVWPTANFHEREAWDLMGIRFQGHPDLRRILMREDWEGHPLRKDYVDDRVPRERVTRESYYEAIEQASRRGEVGQ